MLLLETKPCMNTIYVAQLKDKHVKLTRLFYLFLHIDGADKKYKYSKLIFPSDLFLKILKNYAI
jgi:hypothetical protein